MSAICSARAEGRLACPASPWLSVITTGQTTLWLTPFSPSSTKYCLNFPRKITFNPLPHCPPEIQAETAETLCISSLQSTRFLQSGCPGTTSSAGGPRAFLAYVHYCFQREGPLLSSPCCLPEEMDSAGKYFSLSQISFQVDPILSRLPAVPQEQRWQEEDRGPPSSVGGRAGPPLGLRACSRCETAL